jgi:alpha-tubulin suppressor-like RCC1 family protein
VKVVRCLAPAPGAGLALALVLLAALGLPGPVRAGAGTGASPSARAAVRLADAADCADVLVVGARGDNEGRVGAGGRRFGATTHLVRIRLTALATAAGRSVRSEAVRIDAPPLRTLVRTAVPARNARPTRRADAAVRPAGVRVWQRGVATGSDRVAAHVRRAVAACPSQQVVLVGYSQGASAVHRALPRLLADPAIAPRIGGAVLVADGDRRTSGRLAGAVTALGRPADSVGAGVVHRRLRPTVPLPAATGHGEASAPVWDVCSRGDLVCDLDATPLRRARAVHTAYRTQAGRRMLDAAASGLWRRLARAPVPLPATLQTLAGMQVDLQLRVLVADDDRAAVRWAPESLPAGLALSPSGRLTGATTATGDLVVAYTVRNDDPALPLARRGTVLLQVRSAGAARVSAGGEQTCSVEGDGSGWCWGRNTWGQLGRSGIDRLSPVRVGTADDWATLSSGGAATCGIRGNGSLWCWGLNQYGQVGDGTLTTRHEPVRIATGRWLAVTTGWAHACALRTDGSAWCWGKNSSGQLGTGTRTQRLVPARVGTTTWVSLAAGGWHTCGVTTDGSARCWGANDLGQVGDGSQSDRLRPTPLGPATGWVQVDASWAHTCALRSEGSVWCWGLNDRGQLGDGTRLMRSAPSRVAGDPDLVAVSLGDAHTCALTRGRRLRCWGDNTYGQLGVRATARSTVPVGSASGTWSAVEAGWLHTCGRTVDGRVRCWGNNEAGQLGDGTKADRIGAVTVPSGT